MLFHCIFITFAEINANNMKNRIFFCFTLLFLLLAGCVSAQEIKLQPAYSSGEVMKCNLYFNWKFVWIKAGAATLTVQDTIYNGQKAKCMKLLSSTNKRADKFFLMRDTLLTVFTDNYEPLYYRKASLEGSKYRLNQVWYEYLGGNNVKVSQSFIYRGEPEVFRTDTLQGPIYDMMSLLAYARNIDFASLKKGERHTFQVATGKRIEPQHIVYRGKKRTKSDQDVKYDCFRVSLITEKKGKEKEILNFHITDDDNHLPVLLDLVLNFGSAKARLLSVKGLKHPLTSVIDD